MKQAKFFLLAVAVTAAPMLVSAQATGSGMTYEQFNHLDKDGSGTISESEYREFMEGAFKELDTDRNNSLNAEEAARVLTADQFNKVDANGNGRINRQEFLDHVMGDFHRSDNNRDGQLHP